VDVCSQGEGTLVGEQVSAKEAAYQGMGRPGYPDFDRTAIERFIGE
jgi:hypothetical protein